MLVINRKSMTVFAAVIFVTAAFTGCVGSANATGTLAFFVKDAPEDDYDQVFVTFTKVSIRNETDAWITVMEGEATIDLLALSDPLAKEKLGLVELPTGAYDQIRVTVASAKGVKDDNDTTFKVPSGVLKLRHAFTIDAGEETQIVLDFDLSRSIVTRPNGTPIFKPVVKAVKDNKHDHDGDGKKDIDDADHEGDEPEQDLDVDEDDDRDDGKSTDRASPYADEYAPTSNFALRIKDSPTDRFKEIHVVVSSAKATMDNGSSVMLLENGSLDYDLLALSGDGVSALLAEAALENGNYTGLGFTVTESYGVLENGSRVDFKNPSGKKTIKHAFVVSDDLTEITIDLDLEKGIKEAGKSGTWIFTPVIKSVKSKDHEYRDGAEHDGDDEYEDVDDSTPDTDDQGSHPNGKRDEKTDDHGTSGRDKAAGARDDHADGHDERDGHSDGDHPANETSDTASGSTSTSTNESSTSASTPDEPAANDTSMNGSTTNGTRTNESSTSGSATNESSTTSAP